MNNIKNFPVIMIDNYDSFTYNIYQYICEITSNVKVYRNDRITIEEIIRMNPQYIVISPGPKEPEHAGICKQIIKQLGKKIKILGVCLGYLCINEVFGGRTIRAAKVCHGKTSMIINDQQTLFKGLPRQFKAARYHSLIVDRNSLSKDLEISAQTSDGVIMGIRHKKYPIEGVQFHPESFLTQYGKKMIENFFQEMTPSSYNCSRPVQIPEENPLHENNNLVSHHTSDDRKTKCPKGYKKFFGGPGGDFSKKPPGRRRHQIKNCREMDKPLEIKPQIEELSLDSITFYDIAQYYAARPHFVFLDSRLHENRLGKYSFIAFQPFLVFKSKGSRVWLRQGQNGTVQEKKVDNIFDALKQIMRKYQIQHDPGQAVSPFLGGGIGYFAYELGRQIEVLPVNTRDVMGIPECYICFYNAVIIYHHEKEKIFISYFHPGCDCGIGSIRQLTAEINAIPPGLYRAKGISPGWKTLSEENMWAHSRGDFTRRQYIEAIDGIKEYIAAGDVYQVDMTQRFEIDMDDIPPWELYKRLMHINPSPFAAYLNFEGVTVVSSSPERFIIVNGSYVETRPIKGTIKRGTTPEQDRENREFLLNDEKNRAELAMIVDLMRNDLGRVCQPGSVKVQAFPELETYASVHHLVSTITGELTEGKDVVDVLKATFPGGSVTGAPKIRAMEIIDELEPVERGIYTGSIGYLGFNGCADLNIVIRTIIVTGKKAHIQAGGGIVADSIDTGEYEETLLKAQKLLDAFIGGGGWHPRPIHGQPDAVLSELHLKSLPKKQSL